MQGGKLVHAINMEENILQIEHLPCGNYTLVVSQDRDDYPTNVRLSLICQGLAIAQVALRASDPHKLKPATMLFDYEYHQSPQGTGQQFKYLWICLN